MFAFKSEATMWLAMIVVITIVVFAIEGVRRLRRLLAARKMLRRYGRIE